MRPFRQIERVEWRALGAVGPNSDRAEDAGVQR